MPSYDYVYGSRVIVQCKKQVNPQVWKDDSTYSRYLKVVNKRNDFFHYWYKLRTDIQCRVREPPKETISDEIKQQQNGTDQRRDSRQGKDHEGIEDQRDTYPSRDADIP